MLEFMGVLGRKDGCIGGVVVIGMHMKEVFSCTLGTCVGGCSGRCHPWSCDGVGGCCAGRRVGEA